MRCDQHLHLQALVSALRPPSLTTSGHPASPHLSSHYKFCQVFVCIGRAGDAGAGVAGDAGAGAGVEGPTGWSVWGVLVMLVQVVLVLVLLVVQVLV